MPRIQLQIVDSDEPHSDCDGQLVIWFASLRFRQRSGGEQQDTYAFGEQYWEDIGEHQQRLGVDKILFADCSQPSSDDRGRAKRIADCRVHSERRGKFQRDGGDWQRRIERDDGHFFVGHRNQRWTAGSESQQRSLRQRHRRQHAIAKRDANEYGRNHGYGFERIGERYRVSFEWP